MESSNILFILGTRPEAIKLAPLWDTFMGNGNRYDVKVCSTGQHDEMLNPMLDFFGMAPDYNLNLMAPDQTLFELTSKRFKEIESILEESKPDLIFVQGDTTSAFIVWLSGYYRKVKVAHIEAGLRTYSKYSPFPEEINRVLGVQVISICLLGEIIIFLANRREIPEVRELGTIGSSNESSNGPVERPLRLSIGRMRSEGVPPRVLWVADKLGYGDCMHGLGAYFKQVLPALPEGSAIPVVLRSSDGLTAQFSAAGVPLRRLQHGKFDPRSFWALWKLARREQVDLLHLHGYGSSTFGRIVALLTGKVAIIHQHDSIMHAPWYGRVLDWLLAPLARRALVVSDSVADYCVEFRSIPRERISVLVNAVAAPTPLSEQELDAWMAGQQIQSDDRLIGTLTRLRGEKGIGDLIDAFPQVLAREPQALLAIFGDGEDRALLEARADELGVSERIRFLGFVPDAAQFLPAMELFVLPSLSEGLSFALMEALAAGVPAVVTAVGGMAELLVDGDDAVLVPAQAPAALAAGLLRVLEDPEFAARIRAGALKTSRKFSLDRHVDELLGIYRQAVRG